MADALDGRAFVGVVNAGANLALLSRPDLAAYVTVAERLGSLQAQLLSGKLARIRITLAGPLVADSAVAAALKTAVLKGLLTVTQGEAGGVNYVSAPALAAELGIETVEAVSPKSGAYTNLVTVAFENGEGEVRSMSASAFDGGRDARIVAVDSFKVDIAPAGECRAVQWECG